MQSSFFQPVSNAGSTGIHRARRACEHCRRRKVKCFAENDVPCQPISKLGSWSFRRSKNGKLFSRSAKACEVCQRRKVKCDVVGNGIPCSNCVHANVVCTILDHLPRKRTKLGLEGRKRRAFIPKIDDVKANPITDDANPPPTAMELDNAPAKTYAHIGSSESQIQEGQESVELQLLSSLLPLEFMPVSENLATEVDSSYSLWHVGSIGNYQMPGWPGYEDQIKSNAQPFADQLDNINGPYISLVNWGLWNGLSE